MAARGALARAADGDLAPAGPAGTDRPRAARARTRDRRRRPGRARLPPAGGDPRRTVGDVHPAVDRRAAVGGPGHRGRSPERLRRGRGPPAAGRGRPTGRRAAHHAAVGAGRHSRLLRAGFPSSYTESDAQDPDRRLHRLDRHAGPGRGLPQRCAGGRRAGGRGQRRPAARAGAPLRRRHRGRGRSRCRRPRGRVDRGTRAGRSRGPRRADHRVGRRPGAERAGRVGRAGPHRGRPGGGHRPRPRQQGEPGRGRRPRDGARRGHRHPHPARGLRALGAVPAAGGRGDRAPSTRSS